MRGIKRSLKRIGYYWKKNVLIVISFVLITVILLIMSSLQENMENAMDEMGSRIGADLTVRKKDATSYSYHQNNYYPFSAAKALGTVKNVTNIDYMVMSNVGSNDVKALPSEYQRREIEASEARGTEYYDDDESRLASEITVVGVSDMEQAWAFSNRDAYIMEGDGITEENANDAVAVVSKRFLRDNYLTIGDDITLYNQFQPSLTITVRIIGIHSANYEDAAVASSQMNYIYIPIQQGLLLSGGKVFETMLHTDAPADSDRIAKDVQAVLKEETGEEYQVLTDKMTYLRAIAPMEGVRKVCGGMFLVTYGIMMLVLFLMIGRFIYDQTKEIGTWKALGEKRGILTVQMWIESLLPVAIGMVIGGVGGVAMQGQIGAVVMRVLTSFHDITFVISSASVWRMLTSTLVLGTIMTGVFVWATLRKSPRELL